MVERVAGVGWGKKHAVENTGQKIKYRAKETNMLWDRREEHIVFEREGTAKVKVGGWHMG